MTVALVCAGACVNTTKSKRLNISKITAISYIVKIHQTPKEHLDLEMYTYEGNCGDCINE